MDITDTLTADGKRLKRELAKLEKLMTRVGYQQGEETEGEGEGADLCDIAMWNELGTSSGIPSRPFMRDSVDKHEGEIKAFIEGQFRLLVAGKTNAEGIMRAIGVFQKGLVQREIVDGEFVPNAPATIRRKKSDKPLIDTGKMRQSVNFVIKEKDKAGG